MMNVSGLFKALYGNVVINVCGSLNFLIENERKKFSNGNWVRVFDFLGQCNDCGGFVEHFAGSV